MTPTRQQIEGRRLMRVMRAVAAEQLDPQDSDIRVRHATGQRFCGATPVVARIPVSAVRGSLRSMDPWWRDMPVARHYPDAELTDDRRVGGAESQMFRVAVEERDITLLDGRRFTTIREVFYDKSARRNFKQLSARDPDGKVVSYNSVPKHLMQLDGIGTVQLADERRLVLAEGYPAAEALRRRGFAALGILSGTLHEPSERTLAPLLEAGRIVLWPDNDSAGVALMTLVARKLARMGAAEGQIAIAAWRGGPRKGDAFDFSGTDMEIEELLGQAVIWTPDTRVAQGTVAGLNVGNLPGQLLLNDDLRPPMPEIGQPQHLRAPTGPPEDDTEGPH